MAFQFSPKIVTDGLVLYLDAGNTKSYIGSGTTLTDLTKSRNDSSLSGSPVFNSGNGGHIIFDGTDDFINTPINNNPTSVTVEVVCSVTSNTSNKLGGNTVGQYIVFRQNTRTVNFEGIALVYIQSGASGYFIAGLSSSSGTYREVNSSTISFGQIYHISATYDSSFVRIYVNGQFITQTSTGFSIDYNATHTYKIGRANAIGVSFDGFFNGKIYHTRIYNRALSATEVLQNYNATKSRFGL
jgi:hypothetical protein